MGRKLIALFLILIMSVGISFAEYTKFCGVQNGMLKGQAREILEQRFGRASVFDKGGSIVVNGGTIGGISYDVIVFFFSWVDGTLRLNGAIFNSSFKLSQKKEAIECRDLIKKIYEQKYAIEESTSQDGFKLYYFGDGNEEYGQIGIDKETANGGAYDVNVIYFGPYDDSDDI